ncbi:MAG: hypothetical protein AAB802_02450 [Patescibacteria group bacterium]
MERKVEISPKTIELRDPQEIHAIYNDLLNCFDEYLEDPEWGMEGIFRFCEFLIKLPGGNRNFATHITCIIFAEHERFIAEDKIRFQKLLLKVFERFLEKGETNVPMEMTNLIQLIIEFFPDMHSSKLIYALSLILKDRPFYSAYLLQAQLLARYGGRAFKHESTDTPVGQVHERFSRVARMEANGQPEWALALDEDGSAELPAELKSKATPFDYEIHRIRAYEIFLSRPENQKGNQHIRHRVKTIRVAFEEYFASFDGQEAVLQKRDFEYWSKRFDPADETENLPEEELATIQSRLGMKVREVAEA